jgi:SH3-like domain-containing protein
MKAGLPIARVDGTSHGTYRWRRLTTPDGNHGWTS